MKQIHNIYSNKNQCIPYCYDYKVSRKHKLIKDQKAHHHNHDFWSKKFIPSILTEFHLVTVPQDVCVFELSSGRCFTKFGELWDDNLKLMNIFKFLKTNLTIYIGVVLSFHVIEECYFMMKQCMMTETFLKFFLQSFNILLESELASTVKLPPSFAVVPGRCMWLPLWRFLEQLLALRDREA